MSNELYNTILYSSNKSWQNRTQLNNKNILSYTQCLITECRWLSSEFFSINTKLWRLSRRLWECWVCVGKSGLRTCVALCEIQENSWSSPSEKNSDNEDASPHLWNQPLLHSVNLILLTLLLIHFILHISVSPHHSHYLRSHHLSLPQSITTDLKLISFTNPFLHSLLIPSGLPSRILNLYWTNEHWRLFVLVSCARLSFWVPLNSS